MVNGRTFGRVGVAVAVAAALLTVSVTARQFSAQPFDIASLERRVADVRAQIASAGAAATSNPGELSRLETELAAVEDEVAYLRVKSRRGETVSEKDRREVSERLSRLENQIAGQSSESDSPTSHSGRHRTRPAAADAVVVRGRPGRAARRRHDRRQSVEGRRGGVPAGSAVRGYVVAVDRASRTDRRGSLVLKFTQLTANGRTHDVTLSVTQALESEGIRGEAAKIGIGAGVGAIIGGILGGTKGAIAGVLIGGGGTVVATEGKDVELPIGTILRVRFDSPLDIGR